MKCSIGRSVVLILDLSEDEKKALNTVLGILDNIDMQMVNSNVCSLLSDEGSYTLDLQLMSEMMDMLDGIGSCDRWIEEG